MYETKTVSHPARYHHAQENKSVIVSCESSILGAFSKPSPRTLLAISTMDMCLAISEDM